MAALPRFLQQPHLVSRFQRRCGLYLHCDGGAEHQPGPAPPANGAAPAGRAWPGLPQQNGSGGPRQPLHQDHAPKYIVKNYFLYYLFRFAAALGQEIFYITFLPFTFWNIDPYVARRLINVWVISLDKAPLMRKTRWVLDEHRKRTTSPSILSPLLCLPWILHLICVSFSHSCTNVVMYIGQTSKDILKWPRPVSPPVVKLETRVDTEYGMPSTHAMAATAISFTFLLSTMHRYKYPLEMGLIVAFILSALVSLSRLYAGMHTVLDVICGALAAALVTALTYPFWDIADRLLLTSPFCPVFFMVVPLLLSYNYPKLDHYSPTRADTTTILGVSAGTSIGFWLSYQYGRNYEPIGSPPFVIPPITVDLLVLVLVRFLIGICILFLTRQVVKSLCLELLCSWHKVSVKDIQARQRLEIEVPYKFVTYFFIGFCATVVVPLIYKMFGM
ncbi:sphingosine-1-phosphate phosphatase 2 isoform X1 [Rhinatrema bivittatum]|uniref:sphingosine-1-phosphate phosphatase 2 isoform X1 n=2 Tax=Rhinatrema bivittatum TaxID=194408 RepID=UPI00112ED2D4|nr:sphingosine-1-phosphate phosphatase 2 isoform X1 [Rhinatrema bivittatum]